MATGPRYLDLGMFRRRISDTTTADGDLGLVLSGVEATVRQYLNYDPAYTTTVEYLDGNGLEVVTLRRRPVESVTEVREDWQGFGGVAAGTFDATTVLAAGTDYILDVAGAEGTGRLLRVNALWPYSRTRTVGSLSNTLSPLRGCIKVTYVAGFRPETVPDDVAEAAYTEAALRWSGRKGNQGPKQSESLNGYSYSRADLTRNVLGDQPSRPFLTPGLKAVLSGYRMIPLGRS